MKRLAYRDFCRAKEAAQHAYLGIGIGTPKTDDPEALIEIVRQRIGDDGITRLEIEGVYINDEVIDEWVEEVRDKEEKP